MEDFVETVKRRYLPPNWETMSPETEMQLEFVHTDSHEYRCVVKGIRETLTSSVKYIERIQNPYLWGCYLLKKAEYQCRQVCFSEKTLYHVTSKYSVDSIAKNNFDWRLSGRRAKYGAGVSFSHSAEYAHTYSSNRGVMLVARVLVGSTQRGYWHEKIPTDGKDTNTSDGGSNCCSVYVKFSDHEFYPEYVVHFD